MTPQSAFFFNVAKRRLETAESGTSPIPKQGCKKGIGDGALLQPFVGSFFFHEGTELAAGSGRSTMFGAGERRRESIPPSHARNRASSEWPILEKFSGELPHVVTSVPLPKVKLLADTGPPGEI